MKILQICSARQFGGGERHLADLANSLADRGHDVFAAVADNSPLIPHLAIPESNISDVRLRNSWDVASAFRIARLARACGAEIIHAHVGRDYPLAAIASARSGSVCVLTRHVMFPLSRIHKIVLRSAARVIAVSDAVAGSLRDQRIFDVEKIVTIHNGIDPAIHRSEAATRSPKGDFRVGMVGHLSAIKGQEDLIRAASDVLAVRGDVEFVIAGQDKSAGGRNRAGLESLIKQLGLSGKVSLLGWRDDVPALLRSLDITVSPSRSEPFGLAILEAMASGSPVIATASEGAREIIDPGVTGVLVPVADPPAMAGAILTLLNDASLRESLASAAMTAVEERFSLRRMVDATERLYLDILGTTQ